MRTYIAQKSTRIIILCFIMIMMLACSIVPGMSSPTKTPEPIATQEIEATEVPAEQAVEEPTEEIAPTLAPENRIQSSKILLYEDTARRLSPWIKQTLDQMGLSYTYVGDAVGDFMTKLLSGEKWDLIIVGAENKASVQGDFWDIIIPQVVDNNTALIAEVWYLDRTYNGKVKKILAGCGLEYQQDYPLAQSLYILKPDHPIFNEPNGQFSFINYSRFWKAKAGDVIRLAKDSKATLLLGEYHDRESDYGLLATCLEGRVILQTFSNHDYHEETIKTLWENYITYVLKNHYKSEP